MNETHNAYSGARKPDYQRLLNSAFPCLSEICRPALQTFAADRATRGANRQPATQYRVAMRQEIRFCAAPDGVRIAYATQGSGPAVVRAAHWLTHLEHDWQSPVWRPWLLALGRGRRVVRYDGRGCGLSDRSPERVTLEAAVDDLAAVADAASAERSSSLERRRAAPPRLPTPTGIPSGSAAWCCWARTPVAGCAARFRLITWRRPTCSRT